MRHYIGLAKAKERFATATKAELEACVERNFARQSTVLQNQRDIPPETRICDLIVRVTDAVTRHGTNRVLLPQKT